MIRCRCGLWFHWRQITIDVVGSETKENNYDDVTTKGDFLLSIETFLIFLTQLVVKISKWLLRISIEMIKELSENSFVFIWHRIIFCSMVLICDENIIEAFLLKWVVKVLFSSVFEYFLQLWYVCIVSKGVLRTLLTPYYSVCNIELLHLMDMSAKNSNTKDLNEMW